MEERVNLLKMQTFCLLAIVLWIFAPNLCDGKVVEGSLQTKEDWAFLARFCFLSERGRLSFEIEYPQEFYRPQNLLLYFDDEETGWDSIYKNKEKNCTQKESPPHIKPENNQKIILDTNAFWSGCSEVTSNVTKLKSIKCIAGRSFRSSRERWWYIAASRCKARDNIVGLNMRYKMILTNGEEGDIFFRHFSADEFYILQVDIAFLVIFTVMLAFSIYIATQLKTRQLFHTTYKMYMVSIAFQVFYLLLMCITYGKYANDGLENYALKTFARIMEAISLLVFLLMLIMMAKGFTITRGRLSTSGSIKIAVFMTVYVVVYAVLFIWESQFFDPGEVLYLYESPPGYGLIALRLIGWIWFCYAIFFTLKHYPEKSNFYYPFFIFYTIWFLIVPIMVLVNTYAVKRWVREKVVNGVDIDISFIGHLFILILTRPSAANKNFPYHVRTSQIGVMANQAHGGVPLSAGKDSESFASHPYAPSQPETVLNGGPNFSELFTVSNTHSATSNAQQSSNGHVDAYPHVKPGTDPFVTTR